MSSQKVEGLLNQMKKYISLKECDENLTQFAAVSCVRCRSRCELRMNRESVKEFSNKISERIFLYLDIFVIIIETNRMLINQIIFEKIY